MPGSASPIFIDLTEESGGPASPPAAEAEQPACPATAAAGLPSAAPSNSPAPSHSSPPAPSQARPPLPADPVARLTGPTASHSSSRAAIPAPRCNHPKNVSEVSQQAKRRRTSTPTASQATEQITAQQFRPRQVPNILDGTSSGTDLAQELMRPSCSTAPAAASNSASVLESTSDASGQSLLSGRCSLLT